MDGLDYIIIGLGIGLILIGLFLFIGGKRESSNSNQVEGFGIKLNVSNPSIILIVLGIGLVLVPRFFQPGSTIPTTNNAPVRQDPVNVDTGAATERQTEVNVLPENGGESKKPASSNSPTQSGASSQPEYSPPPAQVPESSGAFFPRGNWVLTQYEENGIDVSGAINGTISFSQAQGSTQTWRTDLVAMDMWGNLMSYFYSGVIQHDGFAHSIHTRNSNDPGFVNQGPTALTMHMDNPSSLHLEYTFNDSRIIMHWTQQ